MHLLEKPNHLNLSLLFTINIFYFLCDVNQRSINRGFIGGSLLSQDQGDIKNPPTLSTFNIQYRRIHHVGQIGRALVSRAGDRVFKLRPSQTNDL